MSPGGSLLLVDQGSTATKAAIVGPHGERRLERTVPVERRQDAGRITHDAEDLAKRLVDLIAELAEEAGPRASDGGVGALGLTCQRSTCLLWDRASGAALTPALSWQDTSESDRIERLGGQSTRRIAELTGLRASPHYAASKLAALLEEVPRGRERAETGEITAGTLDAFLIRRLTGRASTEPGHAGRTLLYELATGEWSDELCDLFGIPRAALPELLPSAAPRGEHRGLPIVAAAGDQQAALLGHGGWNAGALVAHFGTGAFVLASTAERIARHEGLLTAVVASTPRERRFQIEGSVNAAGSAVDWACRLTGRRIEDHPDRELDPRRLPLLLPGFAGLAAPYWRPAARGAIQGLTFETDPETLIDAALYGVAMRVLDCIEALEQAGAISPETPLRVSGKLTRSSALVGLLANAGQRSVEVSEDEESGLEGLRRLAEAALEGNERALGESPPPGRAVALSWSPDRATSARARWAEFVEAMSRPPAR